jgi:NADPH-dependent 2,4-dienoyl-CoA reductase/sulfur reductase-like enzyme
VPALRRVVVVGAGLAGLRTVEELRRLGFDGAVTMVGAEAQAAYDRPPLSKTVLVGDDTAPPYLRKPEQYAGLSVDLRLGRRAVALDPAAAQVVLDDGERLGYDAAVLATGATPRSLAGLGGPGAHLLRTHGDAVRLRDAIRRHGRVAIVGAGFIGCEVAASARALGAAVTVVDVLPTPLARVLGEQVGAEVAKMHRAAAVDLRCGTGIEAVRALDRERLELTLSDGAAIAADVVLVAVGVTPAIGWLDGSGLSLADGIVCDEFGRTSAPGVWAAGDVAAWWHPALGAHRRIEHWSNAGEQAVAVARNLLAGDGGLTGTDTVPYFWSDQYGVKIQSLGLPAPDDDVTLMRVGPRERLLAVYGRAGRVTGVVGFGVPRHVMRLRPLLAESADYDAALAAAAA